MLLLGRNKVEGRVQPMGLVFDTCAVEEINSRLDEAGDLKEIWKTR